MHGYRVASACSIMICGQIPETAARYNSKRRIARHRWIQPRNWVAALPLHRFGARGGFAV
jgi:hypothetical protein